MELISFNTRQLQNNSVNGAMLITINAMIRVEKSLLISLLEKLNLFRLIGFITLVLLMWKWMGLFLIKNHLLIC